MKLLLSVILVSAAVLAQTTTPATSAQTAPAPAKKSGAAKQGAAKKSAQPASQPGRWTLREIVFNGAKRIPIQKLTALSGLKLEQSVSKDDLEQAKDRLYATGCLDSVAYAYESSTAGTARVVFEVQDVAQRGGWRIERLPIDEKQFAARAAADLPCFGAEVPLSDGYGQRMAAVAEAMLKEKGAAEPVVVRFGAGLKEGLEAVIQPKAPAPNIAEVRFVGTQAIPAQEVQKAVAPVAVGTPWSDVLFRAYLETSARAIYDARGRLRAKFTVAKVEPSKTVKGVVVTVQVDEGPVFKMKRLEIVGAPIPEEEVNSIGGDFFKTDVPANLSNVGIGIQKVLARLTQIGYLRATYKAGRQIDDATTTADITVEVEPGAEYKMGRLTIQGLDIETEPAVRKLWVLKPGDPFRKGYPEFFLSEVRKRGVLDFLGATEADTKLDDREALVDVKLVFRGGPQKLDSRPRDKHGELIPQQ